jgi:hypothetical protein
MGGLPSWVCWFRDHLARRVASSVGAVLPGCGRPSQRHPFRHRKRSPVIKNWPGRTLRETELVEDLLT